MLILSRKVGEQIILNDNIELIVTEIKDGQVKIGIKAPRDITIYRKEIYAAIQKENISAVTKNPAINLTSLLSQIQKENKL